MKRERYLLLALGGLMGLALAAGMALAMPPHKHHHHRARCLPYFLIPREIVCGKRVLYKNVDGSRVVLGRTMDFAPMPRPPEDKR